MATSAHDLKISWGPQPVAPVPSSHIPQLLPTNKSVKLQASPFETATLINPQKQPTGGVGPSEHAAFAGQSRGKHDQALEVVDAARNGMFRRSVRQGQVEEALVRFGGGGVLEDAQTEQVERLSQQWSNI